MREQERRWGFVTARPWEFLVHVRRGRVLGSSGQGASCFRWPWDSVARVPTALQQLRFRADQVTLEKVGVEIAGLAVYRIAEPLLAFSLLDLGAAERAQERLAETLTAMFIGATRRLVANLDVEDCLRRRKQALAEELMREIAPVLGGTGRPDDRAARGWGVVLDTIEIQEVRVLSARVFEGMQAPYRAALDQRARAARADADREIATREAACARAVEAARLGAEAEGREQRAAIERLDGQRRTEDALERQRLASIEARAELEAHAERAELALRRAELQRAELAVELERRRALAEALLVEGRGEAELLLARARGEREQAEAQATLVTAHKLPELAAAVGQRIGEVRITQLGGDANPFGQVAQAVASVLELVRRP